jgi:hypothetical protein
MATTIHLLRVSDLRSIVHRASEHPVFGGIFDTGTYAPLVDIVDDPLQEVASACAEIDDTRGVLRAEHAELGDFTRERLETDAAAGLGLVFAEATRDDLPALVLFCGPGLPVMGAQPECAPDRLRATLRELVGDHDDSGVDSLFTEADLAPSLFEEGLNDRLKQLYGE